VKRTPKAQAARLGEGQALLRGNRGWWRWRADPGVKQGHRAEYATGWNPDVPERYVPPVARGDWKP
jgi:hypothetical protein